jgi:hypothetical protein
MKGAERAVGTTYPLLCAVVLWAWVALSGCDDPATAPEACQQACTCTFDLPAQRRQCTSDCTAAIGGIGQSCLDCLAESTCTELEDNACSGVCGIPAAVEE